MDYYQMELENSITKKKKVTSRQMAMVNDTHPLS